MRGKALLFVGMIAGAIFATTPQGKKVIGDVRKNVSAAWSRPDVQRTVSNVEDTVRTRVPVVGENIADAIAKAKPATTGLDGNGAA